MMDQINIEVKDIVFDYFNIITKEYEMSYEKWRNDDDYQKQLQDYKKQIDKEYLEKKFDVPSSLTKQKTEEIIARKGNAVN